MLFLPKEVETVITTLQSAGYSPYLVGGCVREMLRGKAPSDYDMTSDAPPQEVLRLFSESAHPTGLQHGTVTVVSGGLPIELTTMRRDGGTGITATPIPSRSARALKRTLPAVTSRSTPSLCRRTARSSTPTAGRKT